MNSILLILPILISVAFFTLMERKIMGLSHFRLGPNKVGFYGLLQPFSDALKLLSKENQKMKKVNFILLMSAPTLALFIYSSVWMTLPMSASKWNNKMMMLLFITIISVSIFFLISSGWASNSKYSILGAFRSTAQTVSYEIVMILTILPPLLILNILDSENITKNLTTLMIILMMPLFVLWVTTLLAETNRTPFDLSEGESELVSGFNTEYGSGPFAMIFVGEYSALMMMSMFTAMLFTNFNMVSLPFTSLLLMTMMIWIRVSFPRLRYDKLMETAWKSLLTPSLMMFMLTMLMMLTI